ncbi:hypothetical protein FQA39_LY09185 [Lamprigera yunnana]|nr:hypothetical protein FQA39_LY09185 [Lamprigera yunnana]
MNITQDVVLIDQKIDDDDNALSIISDRSKKRKYEHSDPNKECADCIDYIQELRFEKRMNTELTKQNGTTVYEVVVGGTYLFGIIPFVKVFLRQ